MKVTIAFANEPLYLAIRLRAVQAGRPIRDVVEEALERWLEAQEDAEDGTASEEALAEYAELGGVDADTYFQRLVAERRVEYESG